MNKFLIPVLFIAALCCSFDERDISSNGAPIGSTGAPMEQTCGKSNCHSDNTINAGEGLLSLDFNGGLNTYEPGRTYNITVSMSSQNIERFGYQLVALKNADNTQAGTFKVTDSARTQILAGVNNLTGRDYMTYKYLGTYAFASNLGQWTFDWQAPLTDEGAITLYGAAVAANNDGTDLGDWVYTKQLTLNPSTTSINDMGASIHLSVYPNPVTDIMLLNYELREAGETKATLTDISGRVTEVLFTRVDNRGTQFAEIETGRYEAGIYLFTLTSGNSFENRKLIIR